MNVLAVDAGYGYVKAAAPDGRRLLFPSAALPAEPYSDLAAALGSGLPEHLVEVQHPDGRVERFLVGEAALRAGAARTWTDASSRRDYLVLVQAAAALLGLEGEVDLAVGLPLATYVQRPERERLRELLKGSRAWISADGRGFRYLELAGVEVAPQSLAAYLTALRAYPDLAGAETGVLDVGYRTSDFALLLPGPGGIAMPDEARSGSIDVGYGHVVDAVARAAAGRSGAIEVPHRHVERALQGGGILRVRGREVDLRPLAQAAAKEVAGRIEAQVRRAWGGELDFVRSVLVAGGGGQALAPFLTLPSMLALPDALFANAEGFLLLAGAGDQAGAQP